MHAQLEKHWKRLCRVTDLPIRVNSGRPAVYLRASGDFIFSVSRVSSTAVVLKSLREAMEPLSGVFRGVEGVAFHPPPPENGFALPEL